MSISFDRGEFREDEATVMFRSATRSCVEMTVGNIKRMDAEMLHIVVDDNVESEEGISVVLNEAQEDALLHFLTQRNEIRNAHLMNKQISSAEAEAEAGYWLGQARDAMAERAKFQRIIAEIKKNG